MKEEHESYGMIEISKSNGNGPQFFGSDLTHNGGVSITISTATKDRHLSQDWFHSGEQLIRIELSSNQFVDAITSGMNTQGVPCTIKRFNGKGVPQIDHVEDRKEQFSTEMEETHQEYHKRIDTILSLLEDDKIGEKKRDEIIHELKVLKSHIASNTEFVMKSFDKAMEKTVTEAKHTIANYIDHKIHSLGVESLRNELQIGMGENNTKEISE